jgi:hypothetical protein
MNNYISERITYASTYFKFSDHFLYLCYSLEPIRMLALQKVVKKLTYTNTQL